MTPQWDTERRRPRPLRWPHHAERSRRPLRGARRARKGAPACLARQRCLRGAQEAERALAQAQVGLQLGLYLARSRKSQRFWLARHTTLVSCPFVSSGRSRKASPRKKAVRAFMSEAACRQAASSLHDRDARAAAQDCRGLPCRRAPSPSATASPQALRLSPRSRGRGLRRGSCALSLSGPGRNVSISSSKSICSPAPGNKLIFTERSEPWARSARKEGEAAARLAIPNPSPSACSARHPCRIRRPCGARLPSPARDRERDRLAIMTRARRGREATGS